MPGKNSRLRNRIALPASLIWTVEDWEDFYLTLVAFKRRVLKRHGLDEKPKTRRRRASSTS